ncbi:hypothetical protein DFH29DRAFT_870343 [Suillus ampliporus]|nr:hypothetical protein DFH29DRAFT_870343 [Suillus ampliporus]
MTGIMLSVATQSLVTCKVIMKPSKSYLHEDKQNCDPNMEDLLKHPTHCSLGAVLLLTSSGYARTNSCIIPQADKALTTQSLSPIWHLIQEAKAVQWKEASFMGPSALPYHPLPTCPPSLSLSMAEYTGSHIQVASTINSFNHGYSPGGSTFLNVLMYEPALAKLCTKTAAQGTNFSSALEGKKLRRQWYNYSILFWLTNFHRIPYLRPKLVWVQQTNLKKFAQLWMSVTNKVELAPYVRKDISNEPLQAKRTMTPYTGLKIVLLW